MFPRSGFTLEHRTSCRDGLNETRSADPDLPSGRDAIIAAAAARSAACRAVADILEGLRDAAWASAPALSRQPATCRGFRLSEFRSHPDNVSDAAPFETAMLSRTGRDPPAQCSVSHKPGRR